MRKLYHSTTEKRTDIMNVYDFDKTIYHGDSTAHFYLYCLKTQPSTWKWLPYQGLCAIPFALGIMEKTAFKQRFYKFFRSVKDIDKTVEEFWNIHKYNIKEFYYETQRENDVIISASPYFLLEPIIKELGIKHLMASNVDRFTGKYNGINCHGKEKVRRFYEVFPDGVIDDFYSDSLSDSPLAEISEKAYMVKGHDLFAWPEK